MSGKDKETKGTQDTPKEKAPEHVEADRYKEVQAAFTRSQQENKALQEKLEEMDLTLRQIAPFVDMDRLGGDAQDTGDAEEPLTKKDLLALEKKLESQTQQQRLLAKFERENPDLVEYQDFVGFLLQTKTDARKSLDKRLNEAVQQARGFLETERKKGLTMSEKQKAEKEAKEAESGDLETAPPQPEGQEPVETYESYLKARQARQNRQTGWV